ncbi:phage virion morphogenesis protein [Pseudanabaena sp. 'Roaring Creek']|uniref:phage virion morphogenesis protein n=1 Tax=Pseudanabaena sp. 'Roaring Creek' TaxID=1681830 RepID=UPI0006D84C67|nr:phage virion morphogenesis protein [Pseudanabaena sp. 'Roaring Creek']
MADLTTISIEFIDRAIQEKLKEIADSVADPSDLMDEIGQIVLLGTDLRWGNEVDPNGIRWAEDSAYTRAQKIAKGRIDKIMQDTGRGRASIHYQVNKDKVVIGTNVGYLVDFQLGTNGQKKRVFLGVSKDDETEIMLAANAYIQNAINS